MQRYHKIVVAMNLDDKDVSVVMFAARISLLAKSSDVIFHHVTSDYDLPEKLCSAMAGNQSCDTMIGLMKETVEKHWDGFEGARLEFEASEGDFLKDILLGAKTKDADLIIVPKVCGQASIAERIARKAPCSSIMIPPGAPADMQKVIVALDFSEHSRDALETAAAHAKAAGAEKITCIHVYSVPIGYYKSGHTYEKFSEILKQNAIEEYENLIKSVDLHGLKPELIVEMNEKPHQAIAEIAKNQSADILVVGSRGRSKTAAILLGSVSERLIEVCNIPVMVVKKKGQGFSLLQVMFNL